jgi:hypothetical protein
LAIQPTRRASIPLSADCLGWARTAHYITAVSNDGDVQLRSESGAPTRYFIRRRGADRLELTQADDDDDAEHPLLFVAEVEVLERYLIGLFADDIREDLDLPLLDLPWEPGDLAEGFELTDMVRGYRTLERAGGGPLAAAPDSTLSHDRPGSAVALPRVDHRRSKRSFLSPTGAPLLRLGATHRTRRDFLPGHHVGLGG